MVLFGSINRLIQETADRVFPDYAVDQATASSSDDYVSFKQSSVPRGSKVLVSAYGENTGSVYLVEDENGDDTTGARIPPGATRQYSWSDLNLGTFYIPNSGDTVYAETESE
jgi:hypothetical protein